MNEQNGKTPMWLWITLIVVILVGIGFFAWAYFDSKNHTVQPDKATLDAINNDTTPAVADDATDVLTADDNNIADWKTYANESKGFSIQYPTNWTIKENAGENTTRSVVSLASPETISSPEAYEGPANLDISVYYFSDIAAADGNNPKKYSTFTDMINDKNYFVKTPVEITLGGQKAYETVEAGMGAYYVILAQKDGHIYKIFFDRKGDKTELTETDKQIISSFKFTK